MPAFTAVTLMVGLAFVRLQCKNLGPTVSSVSSNKLAAA